MKLYRAIIQPQTAFITPLYGDTLFGHCCWALRNLHGDAALAQWLAGYSRNEPFMVMSSAFVDGFINRPTMPLAKMGFANNQDRKAIKGKVHLPLPALAQPLQAWSALALNDNELETQLGIANLRIEQDRTHNSINRQTGTTGSEGGFSPYDRQLSWFHPELTLAIYVVLDETRIKPEQVQQALISVGMQGFGKEASSGLGKFTVSADFAEWTPPRASTANAWYTLAPCAPQGLAWQEASCYYQPFVRFGRHGDMAVHTGKPFKNPVLLAQAGAILSPSNGIGDQLFTGQGLSGVSKAIASTVHQGYAPVLPVALEQ